MLNELMRNANIVIGMLFPIPAISLILVLCVATAIAPAQKNSVILPKACMRMCMLPPKIPAGLARAAPRTM